MKTQEGKRTQGKLVLQVTGGDDAEGICLADPPVTGGLWIEVKALTYETRKEAAEKIVKSWNEYDDLKKSNNELISILNVLSSYALDLSCISDISAQGREAKKRGEKMYKIAITALNNANRQKG